MGGRVSGFQGFRVSGFQCYRVSVYQCISVSVYQYISVTVFQCFSVSEGAEETEIKQQAIQLIAALHPEDRLTLSFGQNSLLIKS